MTKDEYASWATDHAKSFGLSADADLSMLFSWFDAFSAAGFIVSDLRHATRTMIAKSPPQFRSDHLRLIQANATILARQRATKAKDSEASGWSACSLCIGSGWVIVPHRQSLANGLMVRGLTMGVACLCQKGLATSQSDKAPLTLQRYEKLNPAWREQLETWDRGLAEMAKAKAKAEHADKSAKSIVNRVANKFGMGPMKPRTEKPIAADPLEF